MADGTDMPDWRLTPARPDLAAAHLQGQVTAERFIEPVAMQVTRQTGLFRAPDRAAFETELLPGESFQMLETRDGWAWGWSALDGYTGYLPADCLGETGMAATHMVATLRTQTYAEPTLKIAPLAVLGFGTRIAIETMKDGYGRIAANGAWVSLDNLTALTEPRADWVATAEQFIGLPYVWGGRSSDGLDCSALVQFALQAAGQSCPRDSDMQAAHLGETLAPGTAPERGDLIFWKGHVGIMRDAQTLLHATAYRMQVQTEPLATAVKRIREVEFGEVIRHARLGCPLDRT